MSYQQNMASQWKPITGILQSPGKGPPEPPDVRISLKDVNPLLICGLCNGYLVNATTITECLHSFCKSCIVVHVETVSVNCPTCNNIIHPSNPYSNMRLDGTIQDIVYKLLPHIEGDEKSREKEFYLSRGMQYPPVKPKTDTPPVRKRKGRQPTSRPGSPTAEEGISIFLEHAGSAIGTGALRALTKKYIRVSCIATVGHLQRFLDKKLNPNNLGQVSLFVDSYLLHSSLTLQDVRELFYEDTEQFDYLTLQYALMPRKDFFNTDTEIVKHTLTTEDYTDFDTKT